MEVILGLLSWYLLCLTIVAYCATVVFYRLFLHPLARFPGPKLAAISRWYEGYYNIVQNGRYTFKIADLHKEYANLLNPFFSKVKVHSRQEMLERYLDELCARIFAFADGETFNFGAAITALTRDVAFDFILGKRYKSLYADDFDQQNSEDTEKLVAAKGRLERAPSNIVYEIINSNLPASDKTTNRIFDEVAVITGAGYETTAGALRTAIYHLPYLKAVLMEGLRISLAFGTRLSRIAPDRDLLYGRWRIPAGTPVGMTLVILHSDENVYPEPRSFNPDRWMGPDGGAKSFAPFLRGTRACLGMHLAWAEMNLLMAGLIDRFDFDFQNAKPDDFEPDSDQFTIGTKGKGVLNATVSVSGG
ncbi:cytochrome P450 [Nemania sp. NC0429]|nr:cytochrome P450 [Nemania sp. NC0429]